VDLAHVVQSWDVLQNRVSTGRRVVVIGGGAVGVETALFLGEKGTLSGEAVKFLLVNKAETPEDLYEMATQGTKDVVLIEMIKKVGKDIGLTTRGTVMAELGRLGVKIMTGTKAVGIRHDGLEIENAEGSGFIPADSVVIAAGSKAENSLQKQIEGLVGDLYLIGDAKEPRNALEAIKEGYLAGLAI